MASYMYFYIGVTLLISGGLTSDYFSYERKKMSKLLKVIVGACLLFGMDFLLTWLFMV